MPAFLLAFTNPNNLPQHGVLGDLVWTVVGVVGFVGAIFVLAEVAYMRERRARVARGEQERPAKVRR